MRQLSIPVRMLSTGELATVERDSDAAYAEEVASLVATRRGERALTPGYGIDDPTGTQADLAGVVAAVEQHGPPVDIESVDVEWADATTADVTVQFERRSGGDG